jgi:tetratricopeptide (TPR) repeat protein
MSVVSYTFNKVRKGDPIEDNDDYEDEIEEGPELLAQSLFNVGVAYSHLGNYPEAVNQYRQAREIFKEEKMVGEVGECDLHIAEANFESGNTIEAIAAGRKAVDVAWFTYGDDIHARSHIVLIKAYLALGEFEAAVPHLVDAQALVNFTTDKDWELVVEVEQLRADHMKAGGFVADTTEIDRRLATIREILG